MIVYRVILSGMNECLFVSLCVNDIDKNGTLAAVIAKPEINSPIPNMTIAATIGPGFCSTTSQNTETWFEPEGCIRKHINRIHT